MSSSCSHPSPVKRVSSSIKVALRSLPPSGYSLRRPRRRGVPNISPWGLCASMSPLGPLRLLRGRSRRAAAQHAPRDRHSSRGSWDPSLRGVRPPRDAPPSQRGVPLPGVRLRGAARWWLSGERWGQGSERGVPGRLDGRPLRELSKLCPQVRACQVGGSHGPS